MTNIITAADKLACAERGRGVSTLYVTDKELIERLGVPEKVARAALREFDNHPKSALRFPAKDPLMGNRRYWPAVLQFFNARHGVVPRERDAGEPQWEEHFDVLASPGKAVASHNPRPELAKAR